MTRTVLSTTLLAFALAASLSERPAFAQQPANAASGRTVRVVGTVRDQQNAIALPGVPVQVVGAETTVYTDVDGRYEVDLPPGSYQLKVTMEGYRERLVSVEVVETRAPHGRRGAVHGRLQRKCDRCWSVVERRRVLG